MKVKIGVTNYDLNVLTADKIVEAFGEDDVEGTLCGFLDPPYNMIRVNNEIPTQAMIQTFFHECTHAMLWEIGQEELYDDEGFVEAMSKQIFGLIQNNKLNKIYAFLGEK